MPGTCCSPRWGGGLREAVGELGIVARLGGDEFALMMPDCGGESELIAIGEQMMRGLQEPIAYDAESIPVTISVGIARSPSGTPADLLFKDADIALYEAKGEGRNRFVLFDRAMREAIELRHSILRAIRQGHRPGATCASTTNPNILFARACWPASKPCCAGTVRTASSPVPGFFGIALDDPQLGLAIGRPRHPRGGCVRRPTGVRAASSSITWRSTLPRPSSGAATSAIASPPRSTSSACRRRR